MDNLVENKTIIHKDIPLLSELIFGKICDYMYVQKTNMKGEKVDCAIEIKSNIQESLFTSPELNKKELLFENNYKKFEALEKELLFLKDYSQISIESENCKFKIQILPVYPDGYAYVFRMRIKENLELDMRFLSSKSKLHNKLQTKMITKSTEKRVKI